MGIAHPGEFPAYDRKDIRFVDHISQPLSEATQNFLRSRSSGQNTIPVASQAVESGEELIPDQLPIGVDALHGVTGERNG